MIKTHAVLDAKVAASIVTFRILIYLFTSHLDGKQQLFSFFTLFRYF